MDVSTCPFCSQTVASAELERHANNHFEDDDKLVNANYQVDIAMKCETNSWEKLLGSSSRTSTCEDRSRGSRRSSTDEKVRCLVGLQIKETFYRVEDGLMTLLRHCLEFERENSTSILSGYVDHFQSIPSEDVGWGCGWRNIQMLSSHLLKERQEATEVLFGGSRFIPDISSLQRWLEIAWEMGFDTLGSNDFDRKIYGKRNWIGTTECTALFRSFGLRARIVDFCSKELGSWESGLGTDKRKQTQIYGPMDRFLSRGDCSVPHAGFSGYGNSKYSGTHLRNVNSHQVLIDWIWNYFSGSSTARNCCIIVSEKAPLYFQHDGHSRTIVGVQVKHQRNGMEKYNLLILDPAHKTEALEKSLKENVGWQKLIKRGVHTLKKLQYQLCYIDPGCASSEEMEKLKTLDSVKLEF
ncbi:hypothetical protein RJ639_001720 [Escallonia herrerae]|uniref:UFSP1/2/DUB catalytic domain-containing protein n=1 Tax=Escallonia herrerae TaxID=1293975 RepID=A0AA88X922_9ASTE|nr:hypothetical protein RJ639_001720 [Escallonia herrerae]